MGNALFTIFPVIIITLSVLIFGFVLLQIFSPKARARMMKRQVDSIKYFVDGSKDTIEDIAGTGIDMARNIKMDNADALREMRDLKSELDSGYAKSMAKAIKEGLSEGGSTVGTTYCKYCGGTIERDSLYCKHCGKQQ